MKKNESDHVILRVCKYGYEHQEFTMNDLLIKGDITEKEREYVTTLFEITTTQSGNPNAIAKLVEKIGSERKDWKFSLLPSALFSYVDHCELQEARINAKTAKTQSFWAILISIVSLLASIVIGLIQIKIQSPSN